MNIEEQQALVNLVNEQGYEINWRDNGYVSEIGSGNLFEITEETIEENCWESDKETERRFIGQWAYGDSAVLQVALGKKSLSAFSLYKYADTEELVRKELEKSIEAHCDTCPATATGTKSSLGQTGWALHPKEQFCPKCNTE